MALLCAPCEACGLMDPDVEVTDDMYIANCELRVVYVESIYFTVITMTTVGYGDINPVSGYGKAFDCLIMLCTLIVIPQQSGELLDLIRKQSKYRTRRYSKPSEESHIVVSGDITRQAMATFCRELFHPEHLMMKGQAVII